MNVTPILRCLFFTLALAPNTILASSIERVKDNLSFWIAPISEDQIDLIKVTNVRLCIANATRSEWGEDRFSLLDRELQSYAEVLTRNLQDDPKFGFDYPRPSEALKSALEDLKPIVLACERDHDIHIEF